jgi:predicted nucleotidyltransferase
MELCRDFNDLLRALSNGGVEYLIVGAHALSVHDRPRTMKDLDVLVRPTPEKAHRTWQALAAFGAPISGITFDAAWPNRMEVKRDGIRVPFIGLEEFLVNKDASGREQDLVDAARVRRRLGRPTK